MNSNETIKHSLAVNMKTNHESILSLTKNINRTNLSSGNYTPPKPIRIYPRTTHQTSSKSPPRNKQNQPKSPKTRLKFVNDSKPKNATGPEAYSVSDSRKSGRRSGITRGAAAPQPGTRSLPDPPGSRIRPPSCAGLCCADLLRGSPPSPAAALSGRSEKRSVARKKVDGCSAA